MMQSITAIRMLLRSGELRSVLLFLSQAAGDELEAGVQPVGAEIPLSIIEGTRPGGTGCGNRMVCRVKLPTELLMRDKEEVWRRNAL